MAEARGFTPIFDKFLCGTKKGAEKLPFFLSKNPVKFINKKLKGIKSWV